MARRTPFLRLSLSVAAICSLCALPLLVHADELKLKDGTTIKGILVGFDDNSFKVQTSFGFALVRRDQVISISMSESSKADAPEKTPVPEKPKTAAMPAVAPKPVATSTTAETPKPAGKQPESPAGIESSRTAATKAPETAAAPASAPKLNAPPAFANPTSANTTLAGSAAKATVAVAEPPAAPATPHVPAPVVARPPVPAPAPTVARAPTPATTPIVAGTPTAMSASTPAAAPKLPAPEPIRETVSGNTYTNNTYRFEMYKPPDWQVLAAERTVLPGAIAALGTDDQDTYLLIGQEPAGKPLYLAAAAVDTRLRDAMENFRPQSQQQMLVAGLWATEHRFRGTVDDHEWSGVVVLVPHGARLYTIFGMTRADSDLVQIQENVIDRAIASIRFADQ